MSPVALIGAGCALALAITVSSPAVAQLLPGVELPGLTEPVGDLLNTVDSLLGPVDPGVSGVDIGDDGDVSVTLLGDGGTPITVDPSSLLGIDVPGVTVTLPTDLPELPGLPDLPTIINNVTELAGTPDIDLPDFNGGDNPVTVNPPVNNFFVFGDDDGPVPPVVLTGDNPQPRTVFVPGGTSRTVLLGTPNGRNSSATGLNIRSSKLRMLLAMLQNRGWLHFAAGNGICLPPFAVTQVREILNRREENQLNDLLASFSNDILTMRTMMANCRSGARLQAGDINRVIGVGITSNGVPMLYVL
jgi:hypothetical protein